VPGAILGNSLSEFLGCYASAVLEVVAEEWEALAESEQNQKKGIA